MAISPLQIISRRLMTIRKSIKAVADISIRAPTERRSPPNFTSVETTAKHNEPDILISATKIRKLCGQVSLVTFWRWRHSEKLRCPPLTVINGRLYGSECEWLAWRENQKLQHDLPPPTLVRHDR